MVAGILIHTINPEPRHQTLLAIQKMKMSKFRKFDPPTPTLNGPLPVLNWFPGDNGSDHIIQTWFNFVLAKPRRNPSGRTKVMDPKRVMTLIRVFRFDQNPPANPQPKNKIACTTPDASNGSFLKATSRPSSANTPWICNPGHPPHGGGRGTKHSPTWKIFKN